MAYKIKKSKLKEKNLFLKERSVENPYEIWKSADGTWEWRVLKKWQIDDDKPYARWLCAVKSPYTMGGFDIRDVYVNDVKQNAIKIRDTLLDKNPDEKAKGYAIEEVYDKLMLRKSFRESTPRTREEKLKRALKRIGY